MIAEARRHLAIAIGRATRSRRGSEQAPAPVDLAAVDELVKLKNRRGFSSDFTRMFAETTAAEEPLALVRIDVDRFKQVNDRHGGHSVGDEALAAIAGVLQACVRGKGEAYRVGGDEFVVLLPNHTTDEATAVGERVRRSVHARPLTSRALMLSVSVGVATYPEHAVDAATLEQAADTASYDAKNRGRNLVRVFGELEPHHPVARTVERKQPEPGGLTDEQKDKIRSDYFRHSLARCPHDDAILKVTDTSEMADSVYRIDVVCPFCGLTARLPD
jgi:diguanylate cyclase (GGDEF)-like protein